MLSSDDFCNYAVQSSEPSRHSWSRPISRRRKNRNPEEITENEKPFIKHNGIGINSAISISNIKKITTNKKNRVENGSRAEFFGSNPHSNGEFFSRSIVARNEKQIVAIIIIIGIIILKDRVNKRKDIH